MNMAASSSSSAFLAMRDESEINQISQQQQQLSSPVISAQAQSSSLKRKRNQPGNPNPDAEVIALSPKTLMAKNRFICEVCNKGFQREQNLQLHRRGHNLPWKLKQKTTKEVKRKVYLCPEPTCVHHDPARALGDLTGIKKHYSRKHGEKKYKCEKCSKKYAVQSDWKAHSKTCGTREYRCDCGTLFSRRDSFITHRAFCDALAHESARNIHHPHVSLTGIGSHLLGLNTPQAHNHQNPNHDHHHQAFPGHNLLQLGRATPQLETLMGQSFWPPLTSQPQSHLAPSASGLFLQQPQAVLTSHDQENQDQSQHGLLMETKPSFQGLMQTPQLNNGNNPSSSTTNWFNLGFYSGGNGGGVDGDRHSGGGDDQSNLFSSGNLMSIPIPSLYSSSVSHPGHQNSGGGSAHMSATALLQKAVQLGSTTTSNPSLLKPSSSSSLPLIFSSHDHSANNNGSSNLHDMMMNPNIGSSSSSIFEDHHRHEQEMDEHGFSGLFLGNNNKNMTRDFLGVGEIVRSSQQQQQHGNMDMASLDHSQGKSSKSQSTSQGFGVHDGNFQ